MGGKVGNTLAIGNNLLLNGGEGFDFFVAKFGTVNCETMSTEAKIKEQAVVYPNPFSDTFSVRTDVDVAYILYDVKGVKVKAGTIIKSWPSIEIPGLAPGLYLLVLQDSTGYNKSIKLIKK